MVGNDSDNPQGLPRLKDRDVYGPNDPLPKDGKEPLFGAGWPLLVTVVVSVVAMTAIHEYYPNLTPLGGLVGAVIGGAIYQSQR